MCGDTFARRRLGGTAGLAAGLVDGSRHVGLCRRGLDFCGPCLDSHGGEIGTRHGGVVENGGGVGSR